eukprot:m.12507 g.12507  ORF g.12507 m.12507 type:complete len:325 (-) comp6922_c0_seq1:11-985(-)
MGCVLIDLLFLRQERQKRKGYKRPQRRSRKERDTHMHTDTQTQRGDQPKLFSNLLNICSREDTIALSTGVDTNPPAVLGLVFDKDDIAFEQVNFFVAVLCSILVQGTSLADNRHFGSGILDLLQLLLCTLLWILLHRLFGCRSIWSPGLTIQCVDVFVDKLARVCARLNLAPALGQWWLCRLFWEPCNTLLGVHVLVDKLARARAGLHATPALRKRTCVFFRLHLGKHSLALLQGSLVAALDLLGISSWCLSTVVGKALQSCIAIVRHDCVCLTTRLQEYDLRRLRSSCLFQLRVKEEVFFLCLFLSVCVCVCVKFIHQQRLID